MSINENTIIFNKLYRSHYDDKEYFFEEILKKAILRTLTDDTVKAETMAANKVNRLWNSYKKQYEEDVSNGIVPLFSIVNNYEKKVRWIGENLDTDSRREYYKIRPELYKFFDKLKDREYEVMSCVICDLLGADKISLTAPGNEGGVDFFARISFPQKAHFLFGTKGPIRIVGQCKKYANRDNVGHMKEFVTTMNIRIFKTVIPVAITAAESSAAGQSIYEYDKNGTVAKAYAEFTREVLKCGEKQRNKYESSLSR